MKKPDKTKSPERFGSGLLAERWGFEPQNAFDTLHDFQSCALDQLSHLSIFGSAPEPQLKALNHNTRRNWFCQDFFAEKTVFFQKQRACAGWRGHGSGRKCRKPLTAWKNRTMIGAESAAAG